MILPVLGQVLVRLGSAIPTPTGRTSLPLFRNQFPELYADEPPCDTGEDQPNNERSQLNSHRRNEGR